MSKSLTFCQTAASDPNRSYVSDRDWSKAKELDSKYFFERYLGGVRSYNVMIQDGDCDEPKAIHWILSLTRTPILIILLVVL